MGAVAAEETGSRAMSVTSTVEQLGSVEFTATTLQLLSETIVGTVGGGADTLVGSGASMSQGGFAPDVALAIFSSVGEVVLAVSDCGEGFPLDGGSDDAAATGAEVSLSAAPARDSDGASTVLKVSLLALFSAVVIAVEDLEAEADAEA